MSGLCGKSLFAIADYLRAVLHTSGEGCAVPHFIKVPYGSCDVPCALAGMKMETIIQSLFTLDANGNAAIRVMELTATTDEPACILPYKGNEEILNSIGTAADGLPAFKIAFTV